jgi:hypothetical protein
VERSANRPVSTMTQLQSDQWPQEPKGKRTASEKHVITRGLEWLSSLPRRCTQSMTVPQAILIGCAVIGGSIIVARVITPYRISSAQGIGVWRVQRHYR